jgi:hypothetical protein
MNFLVSTDPGHAPLAGLRDPSLSLIRVTDENSRQRHHRQDSLCP